MKYTLSFATPSLRDAAVVASVAEFITLLQQWFYRDDTLILMKILVTTFSIPSLCFQDIDKLINRKAYDEPPAARYVPLRYASIASRMLYLRIIIWFITAKHLAILLSPQRLLGCKNMRRDVIIIGFIIRGHKVESSRVEIAWFIKYMRNFS